ncbi:MAG: metallophosphoesterase [Bacteroidota bacterium]
MKKIGYAILVLLYGFVYQAIETQAQDNMLCQGGYWSEDEAKQIHDKWSASLHSLKAWEQRAEVIRQGILSGAKLSPMLPKHPLHPRIHGQTFHDGYTVENVSFESLPGVFVTGNLYRPDGLPGPYAGILAPHGHWNQGGNYGRFRKNLQQRCANLARMGAIVFAYDMVGYGESTQFDHHHPQVLQLQTWNSIRVVDFLSSMAEVDTNRIGISGASGGGTQSFLLTAIDPRIAVSVPVVQVAAHFFGGCLCESGMPIHKSLEHQTSNVEIAALAAPRPMLLISDGADWTKNTPEVEYPYIQHIYELYGKKDMVEHVHLPNDVHDYGPSKREPMYRFFAKHLDLDLNQVVDEQDQLDESLVNMMDSAELAAFTPIFPRPSYAIADDESLTRLLRFPPPVGRPYPHDPYAPSHIPDRIILSWTADPAYTQAVTWRTDHTIREAFAELAIADPSPDFRDNTKGFTALTQSFVSKKNLSYTHSVTFTDLQPDTRYVYRVGSGKIWSEWFHFKTASDEAKPYSFLYFGDAQNELKSMWSRTIREAFITQPKADFMIHAGDLVNDGVNDKEWGHWFYAGGWMYGMIPSIVTPGNHEYYRAGEGRRKLSIHWKPTFSLPENGPEGLEETVYHLDYQGTKFISLNTTAMYQDKSSLKLQAKWLEEVLKQNQQRWTIVTHHHPIYSSSKGRDNSGLRKTFQPLYEKYGVDLVLQGHDHSYGRGGNLNTGAKLFSKSGPVYVVSVSGPKMYSLSTDKWMDRAASNTQLYQVIQLNGDSLTFKAYTTTGELYDAFALIKRGDDSNRFIDQTPEGVEQRIDIPPKQIFRYDEKDLEVYRKRFQNFKTAKGKNE